MESDDIQKHQHSGAFAPGFNPIGQNNSYMTPARTNNESLQHAHGRNDGGGRGQPGGRGNYAQRGNRGQVTPDNRGATSANAPGNPWKRVGKESDESELARRMGNQTSTTTGAPGRVGHP